MATRPPTATATSATRSWAELQARGLTRNPYMQLFEGIVMGLTQGLTEFLPVSSSAHLRVVPEALGWDDPGASFTAIIQLGTVAAVLLAFRADLLSVTAAGIRGLRSPADRQQPEWRMAVAMSLGTVPIVAIGLLGGSAIEGPFRSLGVIAAALVLGSLWLWLATRRPAGGRLAHDLRSREVVGIGAAQAAALIPGISRSGATIGAGLLLGLDRAAAARFSFLLSVPAITLAGVYGLRDLGSGEILVAPTALALGVAFASGFVTIHVLLRVTAEGRLGGFIIYRLALAAMIVATLVL